MNDVRAVLNDLVFPASKQDITAYAERAGAGPGVLKALQSLPLGDYANLNEVLRSADFPPESRHSPPA